MTRKTTMYFYTGEHKSYCNADSPHYNCICDKPRPKSSVKKLFKRVPHVVTVESEAIDE